MLKDVGCQGPRLACGRAVAGDQGWGYGAEQDGRGECARVMERGIRLY
jgi:hypothetical protein